MKRTLSITLLCIAIILTLTGCSKSAKGVVSDYLNKYNDLSPEVLTDMNDIITKENLTDLQAKDYEDILKKQYADLTYEITGEAYDGDEATITVKINVYDLYKAQMEAVDYLANNADEFNDENGNYSVSKYMTYKLAKLKNVTDRVSYTIDFYVVKDENTWVVSKLSSSDLEKIHGIYNYES